MNQVLQLTLFGSPQILLGDQPLLGFATNKAQALLFYLAVTADTTAAQPITHSRDLIATLLWGEMTEVQAKQNLRTVLPELRRLVGTHLRIDRQTIAFDHTSPYWLDVAVLRRNLTPGQLPIDLATQQAAVDLYQGDFLSGFYVNNAPAFEAWVLAQREHLHTLVATALFTLVNEYALRTEYAAALAANRRLLLLEPWSEPAHRQQMLLLAQTGERGAALAQYELCQRLLAAEFGVAPLAETTALYEQIRAGAIGRSGDGLPQTGNQPVAVNEPVRQADRDPVDNGVNPQPRTLPQVAAAAPPGEPLVPEAQIADEGRGSTDAPRLQVAGHHMPLRTKLYGRQSELARLRQWIVEEGCQLVGIFGIGGQGKSALAATLVRGLAEAAPSGHRLETGAAGEQGGFRHIIWHSLLNAPSLAEVLQEWVYLLSDQMVTTLPTSLDQQFRQLIAYLRQHRCLLILDNLESILQSAEHSGDYRPGYEAYGQLFQCLASGGHHSCLLLTSRERPQDLTHLDEDTPTVRFLSLAGLPTDAGRQMLRARGLVDDPTGLGALVQHYSGNPLALKLIAETIQSIFSGDTAAFLQVEALLFDDIRHVLDQQFARLTPLERELILWLAVVREPVPFQLLCDLLAQPPARRLVLEALRSLQRRSLLEKYETGFGLQNVLLEYATLLLIDGICADLVNDSRATGQADAPSCMAPPPGRPLAALPFLNHYALVLAQVKEYVRASQTRLLLQPIGAYLVARLGRAGAEQQLQRLLARLHTAPPTPGYAAANLLHLLLQLGVDLAGYDFSQRYLRQLYLRGVNLPQINFAHAELIESVFTEPFGIIHTAVFSPDGQYLAAGTTEGAIYLWRTADQQLAQVIQAHHQGIKDLAFAQRTTNEGEMQLVLASASDDKRVGIWALAERAQVHWHVQLSHAQQESVLAISFHPDGQRVTSVDNNGRVFVWDVSTRAAAALVHHFATTPTRLRLVAYTPDGQSVAVAHREGLVQLWDLASGEAGLVLTEPRGAIEAMAISGDGELLVTGNRAGQLSLWALPTGQLQQVMETKAGAIDALAFSADGRRMASTHGDRAVRLWDVDRQQGAQLCHTLLGHSQMVWSVVFGPPPARPALARQLLVSGSSDQTVRVWDAETGQSLYTMHGQPRALASMAISPRPAALPGTTAVADQGLPWLLAAVSYDRLVHLWQGHGSQIYGARQVLRGTRGLPFTVAITPNARIVASAGSDHEIDLWDVASGELLQTLRGHTSSVLCLVFHPDGELLASGSTDGTVRLWSLHGITQDQPHTRRAALPDQAIAVLPANPRFVFDLAFSPDGRLLATVGADRALRLWDATPRQPVELIAARKTVEAEGEEDLFAVVFSPDGTKIACASNHLIHLWDLPRTELEQATNARSAAVADNIRLPIAQLPSPAAAALILRQHTAWIFTLAFSPDGAILASSGADCTICLWDVASGTLRHILRGHSETIYKVLFGPDGHAVLSCSFDGTIKFWDSQTGDCLNTLQVEGPYAGMNITGVTGITTAQKAALKQLGAVADRG